MLLMLTGIHQVTDITHLFVTQMYLCVFGKDCERYDASVLEWSDSILKTMTISSQVWHHY